MSGGRSRRTSRVLRWGVVIVAAVTLLACAPAAFAAAPAAPKAIHVAADKLMRSYMQQYDKDGFAAVVDYGKRAVYKTCLAGLKLRVDPALKPLAKYDPKTKILTLSKDPRKVKGSESSAWGRIVWHEVTHALEDQHGDIGFFNSEAYAERNIDYMMYVGRNAVAWLGHMETQAKAGASAEKLRDYWQKYLSDMEYAANLVSATGYPPDLTLMLTWFGFKANADEIKALYLTDKAFSGEKWANLRAALIEWTGTWVIDRESMPHLTLTQTGSVVNGVWGVPPVSGDVYQPLHGTLSADGMTLTADWTALTTGPDGVHMWNEVDHLVATLTPGSKTVPDRWQGVWTGTATRADGKYTSVIDQSFAAERVK
jgi:hypothetical protein